MDALCINSPLTFVSPLVEDIFSTHVLHRQSRGAASYFLESAPRDYPQTTVDLVHYLKLKLNRYAVKSLVNWAHASRAGVPRELAASPDINSPVSQGNQVNCILPAVVAGVNFQ